MRKTFIICCTLLALAATSFAAITEATPRAEYTAAGGATYQCADTGDASQGWPIWVKTDLRVWLDGTLQVVDTDYTVTFTAGDDSDCSITFVSTPTVGLAITMERASDQEKASDFATSGPFSMASLNSQVDYLTTLTQDLTARIDRTARLDPGEEISSDFSRLPQPEANTVLGYDTNGSYANLTYSITGTWEGLNLKHYTELKAITGQVEDDQSLVAGRVTAGDQGGGVFLWDASDLSTEVTADTAEGVYVAPSSDATGASGAWVRNFTGDLLAAWFGVVADGVTDNTTAFDAVLAYAKANSPATIRLSPGISFFSSELATVSAASDISLIGSDKAQSTMKWDSAISTADDLLYFLSSDSITIENITFDADNYTATSTASVLQFRETDNVTVKGNRITKYSSIAVGLQSCSKFEISGNDITRSAAISSTNYAINISSNVSTSTVGLIKDNYIINSGMGVWGTYFTITNNYVSGSAYGAALAINVPDTVTITTTNQTFHTVTDNVFINGVGIDDDGFPVCGIENGAPFTIISGNTLSNNAGNGLRNFARSCLISENICLNNGQEGSPPSPYHAAGIASLVGTGTAIDGGFSLITGNKCTDSGGGDQTYGYYENEFAGTLSGVKVVGNDFQGNATGEAVLVVGTVYDDGHDRDGSASYVGSTIAVNTVQNTAVTLAGAALGDTVIASADEDLQGLSISAYVASAGIAMVTFANDTGAGVTLGGGTVRAILIKQRP